jgi:hypothetical protein
VLPVRLATWQAFSLNNIHRVHAKKAAAQAPGAGTTHAHTRTRRFPFALHSLVVRDLGSKAPTNK